MHHAHFDFWQAFCRVEQLVIAQVFICQRRLTCFQVGQVSAQDAKFFDRGQHAGLALNHHIAVLIDTAGVQHDAVMHCVQCSHADGHRQAVPDVYRL